MTVAEKEFCSEDKYNINNKLQKKSVDKSNIICYISVI